MTTSPDAIRKVRALAFTCKPENWREVRCGVYGVSGGGGPLMSAAQRATTLADLRVRRESTTGATRRAYDYLIQKLEKCNG